MATQPKVEEVDVLILGSGEAGKCIAWALGPQGKSVAIIERRWLGGSCPNVACLPSKNVIHSAKVAHLAKNGATFGLRAFNEDINLTSVRDRKRAMIDGLKKTHTEKFQASGADYIEGAGRFIEPKKILVELNNGQTRILAGKTVVICTGSHTRIDDIPGLREAKPLTHIEMLEVDEVPQHLIILGGGYIGLEFAQAMRRFGSEVTVIERNDRILRNEDEDIVTALVDIIKNEGVKFLTSTTVSKIEGTSGQSVTVTGTSSGEPVSIKGTHILVAAGRTPNTENIGLEDVGIKLTPRKFVSVDEHLKTSVDGVFAVGDCAGSPHFTHMGYDDFRIVVETLAGRERSTKDRQVPFTLFTDPELAHIGLRESEAKKKGTPYRLAKVPMMAFLRTRTLGETIGFAKALVSPDDKILGFTALGSGAGELLPVVQLAMTAGLPYTSISDLIITHPTMSEGLVTLFSAVPPAA